MKQSKNSILNAACLALALALAVIPFFMNRGAGFESTDSVAQKAIAELSSGYRPWCSALWSPPSGEVESLLFALQAAIGAGFIGYYFGRRRGRKERDGNDRH